MEDPAGIGSRWPLSYLNALLRLGSHKVLDANDIEVPSETDKADRAYQIAFEAFNKPSVKTEAINKILREKHEATLSKCRTAEELEKVKPLNPKTPVLPKALFTGYGK